MGWRNLSKSAEARLALLNGTSAGMISKRKKKTLAKAKEAAKEAIAKAQKIKPETKDAEEAPKVTDDIRSSTMSLTTLILCQIVLKYMF